MALADKTCISSKSALLHLTMEEAETFQKETPDWQIIDNHIERTFTFPNFVNAMRFAVRIAKVAEEQKHHPDLHISWGIAKVDVSTHSVGGLSENDFILAAKIDKIAKSDLEAQSI